MIHGGEDRAGMHRKTRNIATDSLMTDHLDRIAEIRLGIFCTFDFFARQSANLLPACIYVSGE